MDMCSQLSDYPVDLVNQKYQESGNNLYRCNMDCLMTVGHGSLMIMRIL